MVDTTNLLNVISQAGAFIAAFAAITAGVLMLSLTKKFGSGVLSSGFKIIAMGVFVIAAGITIDAIGVYVQTSANITWPVLILVKEFLFIIGTYTIVIGSKRIIDKLESLVK